MTLRLLNPLWFPLSLKYPLLALLGALGRLLALYRLLGRLLLIFLVLLVQIPRLMQLTSRGFLRLLQLVRGHGCSHLPGKGARKRGNCVGGGIRGFFELGLLVPTVRALLGVCNRFPWSLPQRWEKWGSHSWIRRVAHPAQTGEGAGVPGGTSESSPWGICWGLVAVVQLRSAYAWPGRCSTPDQ